MKDTSVTNAYAWNVLKKVLNYKINNISNLKDLLKVVHTVFSYDSSEAWIDYDSNGVKTIVFDTEFGPDAIERTLAEIKEREIIREMLDN